MAKFFDLLGEERCQEIGLVSADAAEWIGNMVHKRCAKATLCIDPFHVVQWVSGALDEVRAEVWREARKNGMDAQAKALKGCRYALWKNPKNLTVRQKEKLGIDRGNL